MLAAIALLFSLILVSTSYIIQDLVSLFLLGPLPPFVSPSYSYLGRSTSLSSWGKRLGSLFALLLTEVLLHASCLDPLLFGSFRVRGAHTFAFVLLL